GCAGCLVFMAPARPPLTIYCDCAMRMVSGSTWLASGFTPKDEQKEGLSDRPQHFFSGRYGNPIERTVGSIRAAAPIEPSGLAASARDQAHTDNRRRQTTAPSL